MSFPTPQTGQVQSSGKSSNFVPSASSSYIYPQAVHSHFAIFCTLNFNYMDFNNKNIKKFSSIIYKIFLSVIYYSVLQTYSCCIYIEDSAILSHLHLQNIAFAHHQCINNCNVYIYILKLFLTSILFFRGLPLKIIFTTPTFTFPFLGQVFI